MTKVLKLLGLALLVPALPAMAEETRQLGAHMHGESRLNLAIEGERIEMELNAPGADIVGFEHAPSTKAQRAALEKATASLRAPLDLFGFPKAAACRVESAQVSFEQGEAREAHEHASGEAGKAEPAHDHAKAADEEGGHAEFHAVYRLRCAKPAALDALSLAFFKRFPQAERLEVQLVSDAGQTSAELSRGNATLRLR